MSTRLRLQDVRRAWEARDPDLPGLVTTLTGQDDEAPGSPPPRGGALTLAGWLSELHGVAFGRKSPDEQARVRTERFRALESPSADVPPPERLRLHEVVSALWEDNGPYARACLLEVIAGVPLRYGPWRALKRVFKEAEARGDTEIFGALAARLDGAPVTGESEVTARTVAYLRRRAWRFLRRTARERPACYADVAADVLARYDESTRWEQTWVANHIVFHETGEYDRSTFRFKRRPSGLNDRAFAPLWKRTPRPLFGLLERARSDRVRQFAADALRADFRAVLREVEPAWVARLTAVRSRPVDEFVVWVLNNVPRFEQASFRDLGLHDAVLSLFESPADTARAYAAEYARAHARDLPVGELVRLADNAHAAVRRLAADLLQSRDPREDVGLDAWGRLLASRHGRELALSALRKHFGTRELTPDWFRDRLAAAPRSADADDFAEALLGKLLLQTYQPAALGPGFFLGLLDVFDPHEAAPPRRVAEIALDQLARFDLNALPPEALQRLVLRPATRGRVSSWVDEGRLKAPALGVGFLKALAFHPDWETDARLVELRRGGPPWARALSFDEGLSERVLAWLGDVRRFAPADLGFEWLLRLAARGEPRYHNFAVTTMVKGFTPADFAPKTAATPPAAGPALASAEVDFGGASFLFTGKLATMQRKEAEDKVRRSGGTVASGVTAKLHYLVIGDEGSPLYGHGKKGSKQTKAEELNTAGANIKIVSETAFLKMTSGQTLEVGAGDALAGAERLWEMAGAPGQADAPMARFAVRYLRLHHPDIALAETDRPVDPGAEIPAEFLTLERVEPLLAETRKPLRDFGLELARWELARWAPGADVLVRLAESPHADVRRFVAEALLADDTPENRRFRVDPGALGPAAVFRFCESADESTRALGVRLIERSPRFRLPEELFRLTESPDRAVRAFVIRALWAMYRDRGITPGWKPQPPPAPTVGGGAKKAAAARAEAVGTGPPARPENLPASPRGLWEFLRRTLFEIPPPRPEKREPSASPADRMRPLPARRAKLALIETVRDLALEDEGFARGVLPLLEEFLDSRGPSEQAACLVAVTRVRHAYPALNPGREGATP